MWQSFNRKSAIPLTEAEQALKAWGIKYQTKPDGSILVPGDLDISCKNLSALPDLTAVTVGDDFSCSKNQLTSLKGAPRAVGGIFDCSDNQLTSLEGSPGSFRIFNCSHNRLTSLQGVAHIVCYSFWCVDNRLTSLKGAPQTPSTGSFHCYGNQLTSLEGAPTRFHLLQSDFGNFRSSNFGSTPCTKALSSMT